MTNKKRDRIAVLSLYFCTTVRSSLNYFLSSFFNSRIIIYSITIVMTVFKSIAIRNVVVVHQVSIVHANTSRLTLYHGLKFGTIKRLGRQSEPEESELSLSMGLSRKLNQILFIFLSTFPTLLQTLAIRLCFFSYPVPYRLLCN